MYNFLKAAALLLTLSFALNLHAQTAADETAVKNFWSDVTKSYSSGDDAKMWSYYADNAAEIDPGGNLTSGKKALIENWNAFMKMTDARPIITDANPSVRFISPDVAIVTWDSEADIKIQGQQVGGKTKGAAVVHKIKGEWKVEFDSLTPVMQMPGETKN